MERSDATGTRLEVHRDEVPRTVSDVLVAELIALGVEVLFLNPGTDTAPVQEAVAKLLATGLTAPRVVLCPHEAIALAAAHAYFAVTGRPQVVMVHVDVGTQNLGSMMHNAFRAEAGVVVIAGRTPVTAYGELPGGRDHVVHWQQDVPDQAGVVRGYTKWTADLERPETVARQLSRAFQLAAARPSGPVYLTAARELLMAPAPEPGLPSPDPRRHGAPAPTSPDPQALRKAVGVLARSRRPVITTTRLGRDPEAVAALVAVADLLGAKVVERRERMNFPSTHPAYAATSASAREALEHADVVLIVDSLVPWVPLLSRPPESATVIALDADPVRSSVPGWSFPTDFALQCDPRSGLVAMAEELRCQEQREPSPRWHERRGDSTARAEPSDPPSAPDRGQALPFTPVEAVRGLNSVLHDHDIVVEEATTNSDVLRAGLCRTVPGTYFHPGGSGLGWALGGALGVKLAAPGRRVVAVVGDGSFLFSSPTAALWAARAARAPFLTVVLENGGYAASRRPVFDLFPDGHSAEAGDVVGTRFDEPPDFALLAQACGAFGERVDAVDDLVPALQRGLEAVESGRCAIVVVPVRSPWFNGSEAAWEQ